MSAPYEGDSSTPATPGIKGTHVSAGGVGVYGDSQYFEGVHGVSHSGGGAGVGGYNDGPQGSANAGVWGESQHWEGVHGVSHAQAAGVTGINQGPANAAAPGVWGESQHWEGVHGISHAQAAGVAGINDGPQGGAAAGVWGESRNWEGVHGVSHGQAGGVAGINDNPQGGPGIWGQSTNGEAGHFQGNVTVTGDIYLPGADCAEDFDIGGRGDPGPGTVMVIHEDGKLQESLHAYDKRVAGVLSGAGSHRSGIVLDKHQASVGMRKALALVGKAYCKVDADYAPVEVGDLLTTSPTPGHAMKASDPLKAFGAVIGKALCSLPDGQGLIPVLVALQ